MVTRFIEKNKPTQVNSDKIGVQVVAPVSGISADYKTYTATLALRYTEGETQYGRMFVSNSEDIFYNTLVTEVISERTYYIHHMFGSDTAYYCTKTAAELVQGDIIYVYEDDELVQFDTVDHLLSLSGEAVQTGSDSFNLSDTTYTSFVYPEGSTNMFVKDGSDNILGWISSITDSTSSLTFEKESTSSVENKTEWSVDGISVWTDSDDPKEGDVVYTSESDLDWNKTAVSEVIREGEIGCQVSYSIKGDSFTDVDPVLTEENNVICNIPRYVYLKFSQDVYITEE